MLINKKHVKLYALAMSEAQRNGRFTRVGKAFLERVEAKLKATIQHEVYSHPSKGKTLL